VQYVVSLLFASLCYFIIIRLTFFNIIFTFVFFFPFRVFCVFVLFCVFISFVYSCLFPIFVQVYRPLPPGRNPTALNKYIISYPKPAIYIMFRNSTHTIVMQCTRAIYSSYTLRFSYFKALVLQWPDYFAPWQSGETHTQHCARTTKRFLSVSEKSSA